MMIIIILSMMIIIIISVIVQVMEKIQKEAEQAASVQGFFIFHRWALIINQDHNVTYKYACP